MFAQPTQICLCFTWQIKQIIYIFYKQYQGLITLAIDIRPINEPFQKCSSYILLIKRKNINNVWRIYYVLPMSPIIC